MIPGESGMGVTESHPYPVGKGYTYTPTPTRLLALTLHHTPPRQPCVAEP